MRFLLIQPSEFLSADISNAYKQFGALKITRSTPPARRVITLPPLGLMYLAAPLSDAGHQVEILDAATLQLTCGEITAEAERIKPDCIGIVVYSTYLPVVHALISLLKKTMDVPVVLGGPHITAASAESVNQFALADYFLSGWAEMSIVSFAEFLQKKIPASQVAGLCYKEQGAIIKNADPELPDDPALLVTPLRQPLAMLYRHNLYFNIMSSRKRMDALLTSRMCPFSCKYCFSPGRSRLLAHNPEKVLSDIVAMAQRGIDAIEIMDDTFTVHKKRAAEIAERIIEKKLGLEFRLRSRVDQISPELLKKFKHMGVRAINYGMESGCQKVLDLMDKRTTVLQNVDACRQTKKAGILCQTSWVFGFPGETAAMRNETFDFIRKIAPDTFSFYPLLPLPGTKVYKEAQADNSLVGNWGIDLPVPFVRTQEVTDRKEFELLIAGEHRKLLMRPPFILQTVINLIRHPNPKLLFLGILLILNKIRQIDILINPQSSAKKNPGSR